jgi:hypothetical protein
MTSEELDMRNAAFQEAVRERTLELREAQSELQKIRG